MNKPLKILVIEDSPADYLLLERHIIQHAKTSEVRRIDSDAELDAALQADWDVVLSDYNVPGMDFRTTLKRILKKAPDLPIILVSGSVGEEMAVELLHLGLTDFILKDRPARLSDAIQRALSEVNGRRLRRDAEVAMRESEENIGNCLRARATPSCWCLQNRLNSPKQTRPH